MAQDSHTRLLLRVHGDTSYSVSLQRVHNAQSWLLWEEHGVLEYSFHAQVEQPIDQRIEYSLDYVLVHLESV